MGLVLCATRGGEASHRTQDAAIALARERGDELVFLFVVDLCFLDRSRRAVRPDVVASEMEKMGRFLLQAARERAGAAGLAAGAILRVGRIRPALAAAVQEQAADLLVLGQPGGDGSRFALDDLARLAAAVQADTGVPVAIL